MAELPTATDSGWTEERIVAALGALRDELVVPDQPLAVAFAPRRQHRRWLAAAAVVAVAIASVLAVAPAREAVADWLGIGSTEVRIVPPTTAPPAPLPGLADGARAVDRAAAAAELGRPLPPVGRAGSDDAPSFAIPAEGGVLVRWPGHDETLWIHDPTGVQGGLLKKFAGTEADVAPVDGLGDEALWIGDAHLLVTPGRALAARHVLLWVDDRLEWRLEGDGGREEMVAIARELR